jgi:four helix bundle protein
VSEPVNSFRDLRLRQEAMTLAELCSFATRKFPREEMFGLTSQIRRAAPSVPANIVEGHGRENTGSFVQYLRISQGSLKELETHLLSVARISIAGHEEVQPAIQQCQSAGRMIRKLVRALQEKAKGR